MKRLLSFIMAVVMTAALFGCSRDAGEPQTKTMAPTTSTTTKKAVSKSNPLTGDADFRESAVGKRPVAIVVENSPAARPQWGINSPDMIVEGEVEGGISRMLWFYADYTTVPEKVGPIRSARPSFVKFSELFDAIFVHWGGSHNKPEANYVGGYGVFGEDDVAHIDGMKGGILFGRDTTRSVSSEHRGIVHGDKMAQVIAKKDCRKKYSESRFSTLNFNDSVANAGSDAAESLSCTFSSRTDTRKFSYSSKDGRYHCTDWKTDVDFQNVIVLMADSTYITTPYKSSSITYLNYTLSGGNGYYASNGTVTPIKWEVSDRKLKLTASDGKKLSLNRGNSYVGLASANHGGAVKYA